MSGCLVDPHSRRNVPGAFSLGWYEQQDGDVRVIKTMRGHRPALVNLQKFLVVAILPTKSMFIGVSKSSQCVRPPGS